MDHRNSVRLAFILLVTFMMIGRTSLATTTFEKTFENSGIISYPSTNNTSKFMGVDQFSWDMMDVANIAALSGHGATAFRETAYMSQWSDSAFRSKMIQINQWAQQHSLKFILGAVGTQWNPPEGWSQMKADTMYNPTKRANWINTYADMIRQIQPYGVNPMNEPPVVADTSYAPSKTQDQFVLDYKDFVLECIDTWRTIKPDLVFLVEGSPFYDISSVLGSPRIDVSRPEVSVFYSLHYHYSYDNSNPHNLSYYDTAQVAYWDGNLTIARTALYNNFLYNDGVQAGIGTDVRMVFEEVGGNIKNPNVLVYEQDVFDFAKTHNIGVLWHSWGPSGTYGIGLLSNWTPTLNAMGEVWAQNMMKA